MLLECYLYDKRSLEAFSGHLYYSFRKCYTGFSCVSLSFHLLLKMLKYTARKLEYLAPKVVFYECLSSILVFQSDGYFYCTSNQFSGCQNYIGYKGYCYVCRFCDHYSSFYIEKVKYEPAKLANFAFELFNEIKLCNEFNKSIDFFWKKDYQYRWRDYD